MKLAKIIVSNAPIHYLEGGDSTDITAFNLEAEDFMYDWCAVRSYYPDYTVELVEDQKEMEEYLTRSITKCEKQIAILSGKITDYIRELGKLQ